MEIDEVKTIVENSKSIDDLAKCGPVRMPYLFTRNKKSITNICKEFTNKATEFLKREIKDIEICYDVKGTGFDVLVYLNEKKCRLASVSWNYYNGWMKDEAPKSCFSVNERRFYEIQDRTHKLLNRLGYRSGV